MKYVPPINGDTEDPDRGWPNANPSIGVEGAIPGGEAFEHPLRELHNFIIKTGQIPAAADLLQVTKGVRSGALNYVVAGGSAAALSIVLDPPPGDWADLVGTPLRLLMSAAAGTPATLAVAGLAGTRPVVKRGGAPVLPNEWLAGDIVECVYDGAVVRMISSQRIGLDTGGFSSYGANVSIPVSDIGKVVNLNVSCRSAILPHASDCPSGILILHNTTPGYAVTVSVQAGDEITIGDWGAGGGHTSFELCHGESAIIGSWAPYTNGWAVMAGSAHDRYTPQFQSYLGNVGWKRTPDRDAPSGYILDQWGEVTVAAANTLQIVTLPLTFTTSIMDVSAHSASIGSFAGAAGLSLSQIYVFSSAAGSLVRWNARGY
ncbi:MAG: hypothetical protein ABII76_22865 [Pseudomonadota bacterium]